MRQFHEVFVGRTDTYGTYALPKGQKAVRGTKFLGQAKTVRSELTLDDYGAHLKGEAGLGIIPILPITDTVQWFVIDVDEYKRDDIHGDMAKLINRLNLPLVICNSKSGGAHLYCFLSHPAPAIEVLKHAKTYIKKLGLKHDTEIFPKQNTVKQDEVGSWINLPYFGETRYCMGPDGHTELTLKEFLLYVETMEVDPSDLDIRTAELEHRDDTGSKAPPCIDTMTEDGVEEGSRNDALTHYGIFAKKALPDEWQDAVMTFNSEHISPPMPLREVSMIVKNLERKEYQYFCTKAPMNGICDKAACLKREFGVGSGAPDNRDVFVIDNIRKIEIPDDPIYIVVVAGKPLRMNQDTMMQYRLFRAKYFDAFNQFPVAIKQEEWENMINDVTMEVENAPEIVSLGGQVRHHFREWTGQRVTSDEESLSEGYPVYDDENNLVVFRCNDFTEYLRRTGARFAARDVWSILEEDGATDARRTVGKKRLKVMYLPVEDDELWFDKPQEGKF